jgi:hypothetical protein
MNRLWTWWVKRVEARYPITRMIGAPFGEPWPWEFRLMHWLSARRLVLAGDELAPFSEAAVFPTLRWWRYRREWRELVQIRLEEIQNLEEC